MTEEGLIDGPIVEAVIHRYLDPVLSTVPKPKCLLLGCTHYPVLKPVIARIAGSDVKLVDSAATTADAVAALLAERKLANTSGVQSVRFLATDAPDRFARVGEIFLGQPIDPGMVELIDLQ
jgi:glutamate racemase